LYVCECNIYSRNNIKVLRSATTSQPQRNAHFLTANTTGLASQLTRACNLLERDIRVVRALEPVKPPVASSLQLLGETITLRARRDAAILLAPAVGWSTKLACTCVVNSNASAWHGDVEVVLSEVTAGVGGLDDHLLATDGSGCEGQSVAYTLAVSLARCRE
jgi:hypothetical protein